LTSSERDGLMVLVIGAFALIVALLVVGFGWYAGQGIRVEAVVIPTATFSGATPLPVRPNDPTPTLRGGNPPSVPSDTTPIPPEFPSATPAGYPGPIRGTPVPLETPSPSATIDPTGEEVPVTATFITEPTATVIGGTTPAPLPSVSATTRVSPTATRPGSTPSPATGTATTTATPSPTAQPPAATPTTGGYPPPPTTGPIATSTPYPGP
jgi:hypothetical protein